MKKAQSVLKRQLNNQGGQINTQRFAHIIDLYLQTLRQCSQILCYAWLTAVPLCMAVHFILYCIYASPFSSYEKTCCRLHEIFYALI